MRYGVHPVPSVHKTKSSSSPTNSQVSHPPVPPIRPSPSPVSNTCVHRSDFVLGKPFAEKIDELRKELTEKKASGMVISMLDEVAWLLNLRGSDIDYNPVFFAYALVTADSTTLYINDAKLAPEVHEHLKDVKIAPYEDIFGHIRALGEGIDAESASGKIFVSNKCSWALTLSLGENKVCEGPPTPRFPVCAGLLLGLG